MDQGGLDPTLGAILPLVGVAIGAMLGGMVRHILDQRAATAEFRAAVRVMSDDLSRMLAVLEVQPIITDQDPERLTWLQSEAWPAERRTLARGFSRDTDVWNQLRWTVMESHALRRLLLTPSSDPMHTMQVVASTEKIQQRVRATLDVLVRYA